MKSKAKNRQDARFRRTEKVIFTAVSQLTAQPNSVSVRPSDIARRSGIALSTFYNHYYSADEVLKTRFRHILREYSGQIGILRRQQASFLQMLRRTLIFISTNRKTFALVFHRGNLAVITKMFSILRPEIRATAHLTYHSSKLYNIYFNEIYGLLDAWSQNHFDPAKIPTVANNILYLTETFKGRLGALEDKT